MKLVKPVAGMGVLVIIAFLTSSQLGWFENRKLTQRVNELEAEKTQLIEFAERLSASQRVAQINVIQQFNDEFGRPVTVLRWQEIGPQNVLGDPITLEVVGRQVYVEALVLKFDHEMVGRAEPGKSSSVVMFRRVFGELEIPSQAPEIERSRLPVAAEDEKTATLSPALWDRFWDMVDDPSLAERYGVRVAQCEAPAVRMSNGQTWEVSLDAAGGLNLKRLDRAIPTLSASGTDAHWGT